MRLQLESRTHPSRMMAALPDGAHEPAGRDRGASEGGAGGGGMAA